MSRILKMTPARVARAMLRTLPPNSPGSGVDPRSDIYALDVFCSSCWWPGPFRETALWDLVLRTRTKSRPDQNLIRAAMRPGRSGATMLEKDPAQRPFCMSEISAVLRAAVSKPAVVLEPAPAQPPAPIAKTVMLDTGPPVPEPATILESAPAQPPAPSPRPSCWIRDRPFQSCP